MQAIAYHTRDQSERPRVSQSSQMIDANSLNFFVRFCKISIRLEKLIDSCTNKVQSYVVANSIYSWWILDPYATGNFFLQHALLF